MDSDIDIWADCPPEFYDDLDLDFIDDCRAEFEEAVLSSRASDLVASFERERGRPLQPAARRALVAQVCESGQVTEEWEHEDDEAPAVVAVFDRTATRLLRQVAGVQRPGAFPVPTTAHGRSLVRARGGRSRRRRATTRSRSPGCRSTSDDPEPEPRVGLVVLRVDGGQG